MHARLRLLTDAQYAAAVRDLFGDVTFDPIRTPGALPHQFVHEDVVTVDAAQLVPYRIAAEQIGRQIAARPEGLDMRIADLATRAFRRPLDPSEATALLAMYDDGGIGLVVEAILQSPDFLYRSEVGDGSSTRTLTPFELASGLSFLFLDSIPDDELWARALDGSLLEDDELARQVDRLLALPRVRAHIDEVVLDWLQAPRVLTSLKDTNIYRQFDPTILPLMFEETRTFVHDVLWRREGSLTELLTSRETFVEQRLAAYYGIAGITGDQLVPATAPPERAGVLTQASVLTSLASTRQESIIQRGMYVNRTFLCAPEPGRPPFNAISEVSPFTSKLTESQFAHYRAQHIYCAGCHRTIDPPGRALHAFDGVARWRATDDTGLPVEVDALIELDGMSRQVDGAVDLAFALATSEQVARCVVDQFVHHALGRRLSEGALRPIYDRFEAADRDLIEIFRALVMSSEFRQRRGEQ